MIRVTIWNERVQEIGIEKVREELKNHPEHFSDEERAAKQYEADRWAEIHPNGMNATLASIFEDDDNIQVTCSSLQEPECGLSEELLDNTDVLVYWGHMAHEMVTDEAAKRVRDHVLGGMGFVCLHSAHPSKPMQLLLGTTGSLKWRDGDHCRIWNLNPTHPIAQGIPEMIELDEEEMYGEPFDIAKPDDIVFESWFSGGELFRSGCTWTRGYGKIFYFQPGHETNPSYHNKYVRQIIKNAVYWAKPVVLGKPMECTNPAAPEADYAERMKK